MAPVLQCPDCGHRHPLDRSDGAPTFRCLGCGRLLKVPEQFRKVVPDPPARTAVASPAADPPGALPPARRPRAGAPLVARVALWIVALPVSLWVVYRGARATGLLNAAQVENLFFDTGWGRFWPLVRLLPFWALCCAGIVQLGVVGIARWRRTRAAQRARTGSGRAAQPLDGSRDPAPAPTARAARTVRTGS